ncbi:MAG: hypothetical protein PW788_05715 [Micavibrio sp.]|nr:hypothetical protein [Micavibrio sp.]
MGILRNSFVNFSIAALGYPPEQTGEEVLRALREGRENDARRLVRRQPSVLTRTDDAGDTLMERCLQRDGDDAKLLADTFPQTVDGSHDLPRAASRHGKAHQRQNEYAALEPRRDALSPRSSGKSYRRSSCRGEVDVC